MRTLELTRIAEYRNVKDLKGRTEDSTIGTLILKDADKVLFKGFSCENTGPSTDESGKDRRIVGGKYSLEWANSTKNSNKKLGRWQNKVLWVKRDEAFNKRLIRIHVGNFPTDTEGCILPGLSENKKGAVNSSVNAVIELFNAIDKIGVENVELIVKDL